MPRASDRSVWVVLHCEYMRDPKHRVIDEMVFHVASSPRTAERFIKSRWVSPYSWWEVQRRLLDVADDDVVPKKHFYNHRGQPRKLPPQKQAFRAYEHWWEQQPAKFQSDD